MTKIPYLDLRRTNAHFQEELLEAAREVLTDYHYISTSPVARFELAFAAMHGNFEAVGVANGFDALKIAMKGLGLKAGDKVMVPAFGFVATALAVQAVGGIPVFVDVEKVSANMDIASFGGNINGVVGIIVVHQFGYPAEMDSITAFAQQNGLWVIEDTAQAHFATYKGKMVGTLSNVSCFSFYPTKTLGAFGDGGAILSNDEKLISYARAYGNYGSTQRFLHSQEGENSRLDALQAALLSVKLKYAEADFKRRESLAQYYLETLADVKGIELPPQSAENRHAYHLFVIQCADRDSLVSKLNEAGIGSQVHYPIPVHLQPVFAHLNYQKGSFPIAEQLSSQVLSLPFFVGLTEEEQVRVVEVIKS